MTATRRWTAALILVLASITLAPFLAAHVLGLGDTLNHLARMHILVAIDGSADLRRFYAVHWSPVPYLAMDAVVPLLARVMPIYLAGKIFVLACVLMPFAGASCLHYVVHRRVSLMPAVALLMGANYLLALGFLNYLLAMGLAVMLFAGWVASTGWPRPVRAFVFMMAVLGLYFGHAFACIGYCCAVAGFEIARAVRTRFHPAGSIALDWLTAFAQAVPALLFAGVLDASPGAAGGVYSHYGDVGEKLMALAAPLLFLIDPLQIAILAGCALLLVVSLPKLHVAPAIWPAALAVGVAAAATPEILLSTWLTDFRLPLFAAILLLGGLSVRLEPRWRIVFAAVLALLLSVKSLDVWRVLTRLDGQIAQMRGVLVALPKGSRLLVANESDAGNVPGSTFWTMPLLAVIDRDAFVPTLFTGLTTVHTQPEFRATSTPQGQPVTLAQLADDSAGRAPRLSADERREGLKIYWHDWRVGFDYLLVAHFGRRLPVNLPPNLLLVSQGADVGLYRIDR